MRNKFMIFLKNQGFKTIIHESSERIVFERDGLIIGI